MLNNTLKLNNVNLKHLQYLKYLIIILYILRITIIEIGRSLHKFSCDFSLTFM